MPKCKICGEAVQSGEVMHVECRENWEAEMLAREETIRERAETIREREAMLDSREKMQDFREGFLDYYYEEILTTEKRAKRLLLIDIAFATFTVVTALVLLFL